MKTKGLFGRSHVARIPRPRAVAVLRVTVAVTLEVTSLASLGLELLLTCSVQLGPILREEDEILEDQDKLEELGVVSSYTSVDEEPNTHDLFRGGARQLHYAS